MPMFNVAMAARLRCDMHIVLQKMPVKEFLKAWNEGQIEGA